MSALWLINLWVWATERSYTASLGHICCLKGTMSSLTFKKRKRKKRHYEFGLLGNYLLVNRPLFPSGGGYQPVKCYPWWPQPAGLPWSNLPTCFNSFSNYTLMCFLCEVSFKLSAQTTICIQSLLGESPVLVIRHVIIFRRFHVWKNSSTSIFVVWLVQLSHGQLWSKIYIFLYSHTHLL